MSKADTLTVISTKRDGGVLGRDEIEHIIAGATDGSIPDYQLSAFLMAAFIQGLNAQETADLTSAMAGSGERLDLSSLPRPWVDKHSTGGIGDKTTLVTLPILRACGLTVVKMSGRGLGITGGTIDKLESVPGFRTDLSPEEMVAQASKIGIALTGQTPKLAPADKKLYSLRNSTSTVASIPLIVASILSKKIAGGAETIVLDVKCGSGAFMRDLSEATSLADALESTAKLLGVRCIARITDMEQPLGTSVGNALEVQEAIATLKGEAGRFRELCIGLSGSALAACGITASQSEGEAMASETLISGRALDCARQWFTAQGAQDGVFDDEAWMPRAGAVGDVRAEQSGQVSVINARQVGEIVLDLGAGKKKQDDVIDHSVGVVLQVQVGAKVAAGDTIATIYARTESDLAAAQPRLQQAVAIGSDPAPERPIFLR